MKYKILILDIYPKAKYRISKDLNGGYGTANDYGDSWFSKLLKLYVRNAINFPTLFSVQVCGELNALGHDVDFKNNSSKINFDNYDLILVPSSIVCHESEIEVIKTLSKLKKVLVIGPFGSANPENYIKSGAAVLKGEPENFFHNIDLIEFINNFKVEVNIWYDLSEKIKNQKSLSPEDYRALFNDSIKLRLRADVPIGVSLSGGIDSSAIVSSLIKDFNLTNLNTFSAVYGKDEPSDESEFIDVFKSMVKNMHYTYPNANTFFNDFNDFIDTHNEPVPDIGPYAQYKVMELASKSVTVTLDGQGADEQLGGYHYFFGSYYRELLRDFKLLKFITENIHYLKKHHSINALKYMIYYLSPNFLQEKLRQ